MWVQMQVNQMLLVLVICVLVLASGIIAAMIQLWLLEKKIEKLKDELVELKIEVAEMRGKKKKIKEDQ